MQNTIPLTNVQQMIFKILLEVLKGIVFLNKGKKEEKELSKCNKIYKRVDIVLKFNAPVTYLRITPELRSNRSRSSTDLPPKFR
jgi:hypothetical protein